MSGITSATVNLATDPVAMALGIQETTLKHIMKDAWHKSFTTEKRINQKYQDAVEIGDFTAAQRRQVGGPHPRIATNIEYTKRWYAFPVGAAVDVYQEDLDDASATGEAGTLLKRMKDKIPDSFNKYRQQEAVNVLIYGIQGQTVPNSLAGLDVLCGDGLSLFNGSHTHKEGASTYTNIPTAVLTPTKDSMNTLRYIARNFTSATDWPLDCEIDGILCSEDTVSDFKVLKNSEYDPDSDSNAKNRALYDVKNFDIKVVTLFPDDFWIAKTTAGADSMIQHVIRAEVALSQKYEEEHRRRSYYGSGRERMQAPIMGFGYICNNPAQ